MYMQIWAVEGEAIPGAKKVQSGCLEKGMKIDHQKSPIFQLFGSDNQCSGNRTFKLTGEA